MGNPETDASNRPSTSRRRVLTAIGSSAALGALAGCPGGGGDGNGDSGDGSGNGDGETGERVPSLQGGMFSYGGMYENMWPTIMDSLEALGVQASVEVDPGDRLYGTYANDQRHYNIFSYAYQPMPYRLDPSTFTGYNNTTNAGGNDQVNYANFANCDHLPHARDVDNIAEQEARQEAASAAQEIAAEEVFSVPLHAYNSTGAIRSDQLQPTTMGTKKLTPYNPDLFVGMEGVGGTDTIVVRTSETVPSDIHPYQASGGSWFMWTVIPNSPLIHWDEDYNEVGLLAEVPEYENDGTRLVFEMKDGTFHDGEPIRAQDAVFTFEYLEEHQESFAQYNSVNYASLEAPDEDTFVVEFEEANPQWLTVFGGMTAIFSERAFEEHGWKDDPDAFDPSGGEYPGAGPFEITTVDDMLIAMEPHDGHPTYDEPTMDLQWQGTTGSQAAQNLFLDGEVNFYEGVPTGALRQFESSLNDDQLRVEEYQSWSNRWLITQNSFGPTQFRAFREAVSQAMNRQEIVDVAIAGDADPVYEATYFGQGHPWRAPDDSLYSPTTEPRGDVDAATETLEEAGWQIDGGNLYYPPDADLSPRWPEGETPAAGDFPCLE